MWSGSDFTLCIAVRRGLKCRCNWSTGLPVGQSTSQEAVGKEIIVSRGMRKEKGTGYFTLWKK